MSNGTQQGRQLEHTMTTMFACRSVIKYNSLLSDEQKRELICDIDQSLQFLRNGFVSSPNYAVEDEKSQPFQTTQALLPPTVQPKKGKGCEEDKMRNLYRMYHFYLDKKHDKNIGSFVTRFSDTMAALGEIQATVERYQTLDIVRAEPFNLVSAFIADLYYAFVEFMRTLSEALEANDVHLETEKLSMRQESPAVSEAISRPDRFIPLYQVYEAHKNLDARSHQSIEQRAEEMRSFLIFLEKALYGEEALYSDRDSSEGFALQFSRLSRLLNDLVTLVMEYERATALLLPP